MPMGFICVRMYPFPGAAVLTEWYSGWIKNQSPCQKVTLHKVGHEPTESDKSSEQWNRLM